MHLIDFHAHVLPGIDDGAQDVEEARSLLLSQKEQGIQTVIATPHRYQEQPIAEFVANRQRALQQLSQGIAEEIPAIVPAAEVELYCGLSKEKDLRQLCIGDTDYILIEMPFFFWNSWYYDELEQLRCEHGVRPVIAHLERYAKTPAEADETFSKLLQTDALVQINASALLHFSSFRVVKHLYKLNAFTVLGSDCHNSIGRPCRFEEAIKKIEKKFGSVFLQKLLLNAEDILNNQYVER